MQVLLNPRNNIVALFKQLLTATLLFLVAMNAIAIDEGFNRLFHFLRNDRKKREWKTDKGAQTII